MSNTVSVILIPHPAFVDAILEECPCGGGVPMVGLGVEGMWVPLLGDGLARKEFPGIRALVLKWHGATLNMGMDRAARTSTCPIPLLQNWDQAPFSAEEFASRIEEDGMVRAAFLDAGNREFTH